MANRYSLEIKWSDEDECFLGRCLELAPITNMGGAIAHGDDIEECAKETAIALSNVVASLIKRGATLPSPIQYETQIQVISRAAAAAALTELRDEMARTHTIKNDGANTSGGLSFHSMSMGDAVARLDATMTALGLGAKEKDGLPD